MLSADTAALDIDQRVAVFDALADEDAFDRCDAILWLLGRLRLELAGHDIAGAARFGQHGEDQRMIVRVPSNPLLEIGRLADVDDLRRVGASPPEEHVDAASCGQIIAIDD